MGFSIPHLLVVLVIVVLVFGTKRLKHVGSDLGDAIKGFRHAMKDGEQTEAAAKPSEGELLEGEVARKDEHHNA